jgi:leucyl aminopeptidase
MNFSNFKDFANFRRIFKQNTKMNLNLLNTPNPAWKQCLIPIQKTANLVKYLQELKQQYETIPADLIQTFKAEAKETVYFYHQDQKVVLLGLGDKLTEKGLVNGLRSFFYHHSNQLKSPLGIDLRAFEAKWIENIVNGIALSDYQIGLYQTNKQKEETDFFQQQSQIDIFVKENTVEEGKKLLFKGQAIAETQKRILDLVNAPANKKTPQILADWAVASGKQYGYAVTILNKEDLKTQGLHALLAVGQGSTPHPTLIVAEYKPQNPSANLPKIGLVGKGVTFDTGGVSLKDSNQMHLMKSDMGGAGAVLGMIELAAKLQIQAHLIGVVPATENSIDADALKPSDVIGSYLGKTIEIIDTDAEGRLILADGLTYLNRNHQPEILIDLATLTGSCIATLGYAAAGLFSQNQTLARQLLQAGEETGEKLWQLPLWDDYKDDLSSDVADLRNFSGKPIAGAITAAKFLEVFTENHPAFAHLDIAGVAFSDSEFAKMRSATAYGIRLLLRFLENSIANSAKF